MARLAAGLLAVAALGAGCFEPTLEARRCARAGDCLAGWYCDVAVNPTVCRRGVAPARDAGVQPLADAGAPPPDAASVDGDGGPAIVDGGGADAGAIPPPLVAPCGGDRRLTGARFELCGRAAFAAGASSGASYVARSRSHVAPVRRPALTSSRFIVR